MSLFKWQLYAAQGMRNKWVNMLGTDGGEEEEDQDSLKVPCFGNYVTFDKACVCLLSYILNMYVNF